MKGSGAVTYAASTRRSRPPRRRGLILALVCFGGVGVGVGVGALWIAAGSASPPATPERVGPKPTRTAAVRAAVSALYALSVPALLDRRGFEESVRQYAAPHAVDRVRTAFGTADPRLL